MDLITDEIEEIITDKLSSQLEEDKNKSKNWSKSDDIDNLESTHLSGTNGSVTNQLRNKHSMSMDENQENIE